MREMSGFRALCPLANINIRFCSQAPVVDDDLLEFLVRVAENPEEWNKIRHVLSKYTCPK